MTKAIVVAYDLNPELGSECGNAHQWVRILARFCDVDVFARTRHQQAIVRSMAEYPRARFHFTPIHPLVQRVLRGLPASDLLLNTIFVASVKRRLERADLSEYSLAHVLTPAGVYAFNDLYRLGLPMLVGPIGGAQPTHPGFRDVYGDQWLMSALRDTVYRLIVRLPGWRRYFTHADLILAGTDSVIGVLPEVCRERTRLLFDTCVDTDYFRPPAEGRTAERPARVLFVGSLVAMKGPTLLLEAVRACRDRGLGGVKVVFAGDGPLRRRMAELIDAYGLASSVSLVGQLDKREILAIYQDSDIFCLPTLHESGGTSILEAMACGLPIITSDCAGPHYSVNHDCGIRIDMVDSRQYVTDLSLALDRLARHKGLRRSMGRHARERAVEEFSLQALERKIRDIYGERLM
jgi:glycosyltransferase involved in cell wall biosynthesis